MSKKKSESFEEALKKLQSLVERLERGDLPLEEAVESFTEGIRLVQFCQKKLEEAEKKIQVLMANQEGGWNAVPFEGSSPSE
ncbi:MAG: exodeoxyribonuclease VII small subunit [Syntrophobacteraceae bacterium]|nr:exodeoxyribonuclease VII small subunit [Syntrophobacteraceae bacterium]